MKNRDEDPAQTEDRVIYPHDRYEGKTLPQKGPEEQMEEKPNKRKGAKPPRRKRKL